MFYFDIRLLIHFRTGKKLKKMAAAVLENPPVTSRPLFVPYLEELVEGMFISEDRYKEFS